MSSLWLWLFFFFFLVSHKILGYDFTVHTHYSFCYQAAVQSENNEHKFTTLTFRRYTNSINLVRLASNMLRLPHCERIAGYEFNWIIWLPCLWKATSKNAAARYHSIPLKGSYLFVRHPTYIICYFMCSCSSD